MNNRETSKYFSNRVLFRNVVLTVLLLCFCVSLGACLILMIRNPLSFSLLHYQNPLVSYFGTNDYECYGSCYCISREEDYEEDSFFPFERRRISPSSAVSGRQVIAFVAAVTSLMAYRLAGDHFKDECESMMYDDDSCFMTDIRSEVEECYVQIWSDEENLLDRSGGDLLRPYDKNIQKNRDENEPIHVRCYGNCKPRYFMGDEKANKNAEDFDCYGVKNEEFYLVNQNTMQGVLDEEEFETHLEGLDRIMEYFKQDYERMLEGECSQDSRENEEEYDPGVNEAEKRLGLCTADDTSIQCFPHDEARFGEDVRLAIKFIRSKFNEIGDHERAEKYEKYMKEAGRFYGCTAKEMKDEVFKPLYEERIEKMDIVSKVHLAVELLESPNLDDKKFGILILKKNVKQIYNQGEDFVGKFFQLMEIVIDNHVHDWATADSLAGFVFDALLREDGKAPGGEFEMEKILMDFALTKSKRKGLNRDWRQRIACVSFVKLARFGEFNDEIIKLCRKCVRNPYRFTQLGVGWVLREMSLNDLPRVVEFIKKNYRFFSREGLRYAIEKMEPELRKELLDFGKKK